MRLSDRAEEALETLWVRNEEDKRKSHPMSELGLDLLESPVTELVDGGLVTVGNSEIRLTDRGWEAAQRVIRRHRLAERLLADVLDIEGSTMDDAACAFEHSLHEGIDESICTLLGHPRQCPHGKPIPPGDCCRREKESPIRLVASLSTLKQGEAGRIAYIHTQEATRLQKLMAMGVLPGMNISLIQRFPSYVFQVGHSQFAVDDAIAQAIDVRLEK